MLKFIIIIIIFIIIIIIIIIITRPEGSRVEDSTPDFLFLSLSRLICKPQSHVFWAWSRVNAICIVAEWLARRTLNQLAGVRFPVDANRTFFPFVFLLEVIKFLVFFFHHFKVEWYIEINQKSYSIPYRRDERNGPNCFKNSNKIYAFFVWRGVWEQWVLKQVAPNPIVTHSMGPLGFAIK